jgi:hypothetical protein
VPVVNKDAAPSGETPSEATGVPLADDLSVVLSQLNVTNSILEDILNRLEI